MPFNCVCEFTKLMFFNHFGNRAISWIVFVNLANKTINVSDFINLKWGGLYVRT